MGEWREMDGCPDVGYNEEGIIKECGNDINVQFTDPKDNYCSRRCGTTKNVNWL